MTDEQQKSSSVLLLLGRVQSICQQCPAMRSEVDLKVLHNFVSIQTELALDPFWEFLPLTHQFRLCRYLRYKRHETDALIYLDGQALDFNLFVKGEAELSFTGKTISFCASKGTSFGKIHVPQSIQRLIHHTSPNYDTFNKENDCLPQFMKLLEQNNSTRHKNSSTGNRPSVLFCKGSHCLYLNMLDLRPFMVHLFDRMISQRVLNHLRLNSLQSEAYKLVTFPPGHPIQVEGGCSDTIILTLRGRCELSKNIASIKLEANNGLFTPGSTMAQDTDAEVVHNKTMLIGHAPPMSFLSFLPFYKKETQDGEYEVVTCPQPFTAVAKSASGVRCLVLDAQAFTSELRNTSIVHKSFQCLARRQWTWLQNTLPLQLALLLSSKVLEVEPFPHASMAELENLLDKGLQRRPHLNRQRVLSKLKRLVQDESDTDTDNAVFDGINFDVCMSKKLFESIEEDWGNGNLPDFLEPCPSVVNRKFHGKTLPIYQRSC